MAKSNFENIIAYKIQKPNTPINNNFLQNLSIRYCHYEDSFLNHGVLQIVIINISIHSQKILEFLHFFIKN